MTINSMFLKLTLAKKSPAAPELSVGDFIHVSSHRTQFFCKIKTGVNAGMTFIQLNTPKLTLYVVEAPKDIRDQMENVEKSLGDD